MKKTISPVSISDTIKNHRDIGPVKFQYFVIIGIFWRWSLDERIQVRWFFHYCILYAVQTPTHPVCGVCVLCVSHLSPVPGLHRAFISSQAQVTCCARHLLTCSLPLSLRARTSSYTRSQATFGVFLEVFLMIYQAMVFIWKLGEVGIDTGGWDQVMVGIPRLTTIRTPGDVRRAEQWRSRDRWPVVARPERVGKPSAGLAVAGRQVC